MTDTNLEINQAANQPTNNKRQVKPPNMKCETFYRFRQVIKEVVEEKYSLRSGAVWRYSP